MIGVRPENVQLYKSLAAYRRALITIDDIPPEVLRGIAWHLLEVCEVLVQGLDTFRTTVEDAMAKR